MIGSRGFLKLCIARGGPLGRNDISWRKNLGIFFVFLCLVWAFLLPGVEFSLWEFLQESQECSDEGDFKKL